MSSPLPGSAVSRRRKSNSPVGDTVGSQRSAGAVAADSERVTRARERFLFATLRLVIRIVYTTPGRPVQSAPGKPLETDLGENQAERHGQRDEECSPAIGKCGRYHAWRCCRPG